MVALDGKIYAIGGVTHLNNWQLLSLVEQYDPSTDTWTSFDFAAMPTPRKGPISAVANGRIYVPGGEGLSDPALASNEEFDPISTTWTVRDPMPTGRCWLAAGTIGNMVFAVGGWYNENCPTCPPNQIVRMTNHASYVFVKVEFRRMFILDFDTSMHVRFTHVRLGSVRVRAVCDYEVEARDARISLTRSPNQKLVRICVVRVMFNFVPVHPQVRGHLLGSDHEL